MYINTAYFCNNYLNTNYNLLQLKIKKLLMVIIHSHILIIVIMALYYMILSSWEASNFLIYPQICISITFISQQFKMAKG